MLGWVIILFLILPFVELWLLIQIGQRIGFWPTLWIVLGTGLLGGVLVRVQGPRAWREVLGAWGQGRVPGTELVAGGLFLVGAAFLLTPGVITDAVGFLLMVPFVRRLAARGVIRAFKHRATVVHVHVGRGQRGTTGHEASEGHSGGAVDVEGHVVEDEAATEPDDDEAAWDDDEGYDVPVR